jgi:hypothetical protein
MSIRLADRDDRARYRRLTDIELIFAGRGLRELIQNGKRIVTPIPRVPCPFEIKLENTVGVWRARQVSRRAGVGMCVSHVRSSRNYTECADVARIRVRSMARPKVTTGLMAAPPCGLRVARGKARHSAEQHLRSGYNRMVASAALLTEHASHK